ncbi:MAG: MBL fold metallo-hydrolase [Polyangiaceae bacterium]|nr:MBL fold metallo-hydrolase [Polyangiaceae bacterium]
MQQFSGLSVETIVNGPLSENCYIVSDTAAKSAIIIDAGDEANRIADAVKSSSVKVSEILCTHGHIDHAGAVAELKEILGVPFAIHPDDRAWIEHIVESAKSLGFRQPPVPKIDRELSDGEELRFGNVTGKVLHTPGHTLGGCCFYFPQQRVVFVGDTLFACSVGRTDLPGGSSPQLIRSIRERLLTLDDDVVVFSGHGRTTTIGSERRSNPFLR